MKINVVAISLTLIFAFTLFAEELREIDIPIFEGGYGVKFYQDVARAHLRKDIPVLRSIFTAIHACRIRCVFVS